MKKLPTLILGAVIAAQLTVPVSMIRSRELVLKNGECFRFKTRPIDPADPFQGRYVRLGFESDHILCEKQESENLDHKQKIYATVETDSEGFAYFSGWSLSPPETGTYLETRYRNIYSARNPETEKWETKGIRIEIPFDRFYMDETKAPRAERIARDATRTTNCWAEVRILEGKAVIEDVFAEGQSLRELAAKKDKK